MMEFIEMDRNYVLYMCKYFQKLFSFFFCFFFKACLFDLKKIDINCCDVSNC